MLDLIRQIAETCRAKGIRACIHCGTPDYAARMIDMGYSLTTVSGDSRLLAGAAAASVAAWRDRVGQGANPTDIGGPY
jgi:4-hydroxy-2-oxoheptanedioate aldolase